MDMLRWADTQKKFKRITKIFSVITVEAVWSIVDRELAAQSDVDAIAVRQIANVTDRVGGNREDFLFIRPRENELVAGFLHALPARINRAATVLII